VNKRARMRLLGVTAIIVIVIAVLVLTIGNKQVAAFSTVSELAKGGAKTGDRVKVGGAVVAGSWDKQSNPMKFTIKEETDTSGTGPTLKVVYSGASIAIKFSGAMPDTIKDGTQVIVTGTLGADNTFAATSVALAQGQ